MCNLVRQPPQNVEKIAGRRKNIESCHVAQAVLARFIIGKKKIEGSRRRQSIAMADAKPIQEVSVWKARDIKRKKAMARDKRMIVDLWHRIGMLECEVASWRAWHRHIVMYEWNHPEEIEGDDAGVRNEVKIREMELSSKGFRLLKVGWP